MDEPVVLVVDDEPAHLRALERALAGLAQVKTAASGEAALPLLRDVCLVISDQRMGGMSGVEFLEHARNRCPTAILILLTAFADIDALQRAVNRIGIYHYLEKPWSLSELRQVVQRGLERSALERQRRRLTEELRREADYKNRLLSILAHELGTPVHIAVNTVGLLLEQPLEQETRRWVEALRRAADRLARGVGQMQRASRIACEDLRLCRRQVDLSEIAGRALEALRAACGDRALDFSETRPPRGVWIPGDREWLHHLVWNLLTNAVRFTPDGGRIALESGADGDAGWLIVRDTGIGLPDDGDLFVPFSAACGDPVLHGSGWLRFGARGLGLGLALSKRVVDAHGGAIAIASENGQGTECRVTLPARIPARRTVQNGPGGL
jgi:signal transduction histidine kinase